jgi:hypothetical protein
VQVIHARCDEVMRLLAEELDLEVRPSISEGGKLFHPSLRQPLKHGKIVYEDMSSEYEDMSSEYDDQKLQEFERSFMVQMSGSAPPI